MDLAVKDGGVVLDSAGDICGTCCEPPGGWSAYDCCCFLEPETEGACGNEDWDLYPPFGGVGKTPGVFTMTFKVTWAVSGLTTIYYSGNLVWQGSPVPQASCPYNDNTTADSDGKTVSAWLYLRGLTYIPTTNTAISFQNTAYACSAANLAFTGDTLISVAVIMGACDAANTHECDAAVSVINCCLIRSIDRTEETWEYGSIEVSWRPGQIPQWDECTNYDVGDMVAWEGVFYVCILPYNAGADCSGAKEPPDAMYWEVA